MLTVIIFAVLLIFFLNMYTSSATTPHPILAYKKYGTVVNIHDTALASWSAIASQFTVNNVRIKTTTAKMYTIPSAKIDIDAKRL